LVIPVVGVLGLFAVSGGIRDLVTSALAQVRGILVLRENAPTDLLSDLPASLGERLRGVPGVRVVAPQLWKMAPPIEGRYPFDLSAASRAGHERRPVLESLLNLVQVEGQDIAAHRPLRHEVYRANMLPSARGGGRFLDASDRGQPHALISTTLAREYPHPDGRPRRVGDVLRVGTQPFLIVGLYRTGSPVFDRTLVMDIATARELLGVADGTVSCFLVELDDPDRMEEVAGSIERAIPHVDARTTREFANRARGLLGRLDRLLLLLLTLALSVGAIGILNTMLMSTTERVSEFGVLRANGWSTLDVARLVLVESGLIGLAAGAIGCTLALAAVPIIDRLLQGKLPLALSAGHLATGLVLAASLGLLGGLAPAWHASRLRPIDAIRRGSR
jgi:putative ABC transport system permease protein